MRARQKAKVEGSGNIVVQAVGNGIQVAVGLPHLTLIPPRNRVPQMPPKSEIDLLNPYRRSIELVGREQDMKRLWDWLHSSRPVSVRTIVGCAGAGKTRAAIELIERLNSEEPDEWFAGFVTGNELRRFAQQQNLAGWGWQRPTLIVVDYAASLTEPLRSWLADLAQNPACADGKPLRLLLLERGEAAGEHGWLQSLLLGGYSNERVPELFDPVEPQRLDVLDTAEKRRRVLAEMLETAAALTGCKPPLLPEHGRNPRFDRQLQNDVWQDPLYLMMAALLSLRSDIVEVLDLPRTDLALRLVTHEVARLQEGAPCRDAGRLIVHIAAFAALGNGLSPDTALVVARDESGALGLRYPDGPGALVGRLHDLLPAPDHGIAPIVPDIIAEALVLTAFGECSTEQQSAAVLRAAPLLGPGVVPFVIRTAQDFSGAGHVVPLNWVETLVRSGQADNFGLLSEIDNAMPEQTLVLREKAAEVTQLLLDRFAQLAAEAPAQLNEPLLAEKSRLLNNLANRLSELGRREEALAKAQEAARIYEQLAEARPDDFLRYLAVSLNNLANRLSELGRREEALAKAQEAARIYEQLAEARPDDFLRYLAGSLNNLANRLGELGRREEALPKVEEAAQIYKQLAEVQPDAFLPDLAMSLHNLATMLSELGRREEALAKAVEAARIYEQLAEARPDAFLPDLAGSLHNLATVLSKLGRREEALAKAQEAARIHEQLAEARPDAFLPYLAGSLNNLATMLSDLGRREEALEKAQEAVRIREQLAAVRPDVFLPDLAMSCGARGAVLVGMDRHGEAVASFQQGIRALAPLFQRHPAACEGLMASLCRDYFEALQRIGQQPDLALLAPVLEVFSKLKQTGTKEKTDDGLQRDRQSSGADA